MEQIRSYFLAVTAVCMIAVLCLNLIELPKIKGVLRFLCGILVLFVAMSVFVSLDESKLNDILSGLDWDLELRQEDLEQEVSSQLAVHVQETAETHIEQYAQQLGAMLQAKVTVTQEQYPVPYSVILIGTVKPQHQIEISQYLSLSLNIPIERQEWK